VCMLNANNPFCMSFNRSCCYMCSAGPYQRWGLEDCSSTWTIDDLLLLLQCLIVRSR
jgi:hypothetical protein